jgi:hypothetical protein
MRRSVDEPNRTGQIDEDATLRAVTGGATRVSYGLLMHDLRLGLILSYWYARDEGCVMRVL